MSRQANVMYQSSFMLVRSELDSDRVAEDQKVGIHTDVFVSEFRLFKLIDSMSLDMLCTIHIIGEVHSPSICRRSGTNPKDNEQFKPFQGEVTFRIPQITRNELS